MPVTTVIELVVAVALIVGAVLLYRRRSDPRHGSQSAVLLLVVGIIMLIHGLGLLDYRPAGGGITAEDG